MMGVSDGEIKKIERGGWNRKCRSSGEQNAEGGTAKKEEVGFF